MADLTADILDYESWVWSEGHYLDIQFAESEILSQLAGFVRAGIVAKEVRRFRLYKDKFNSFKDWCEGALKRSHWQIKRLIEAARVWIDLAQAGFETLPTCEAQCRPLAKFLPNDLVDQGLLAEKWREVIEVVPPQNLTADRIREALGDPPRRRAISLKPELRKRLSDRAEQHGLTEEQLIEQLLNDLDDGETVEEPVPEAAIAEWQDDLENLVSESGGDEPPHPIGTKKSNGKIRRPATYDGGVEESNSRYGRRVVLSAAETDSNNPSRGFDANHYAARRN